MRFNDIVYINFFSVFKQVQCLQLVYCLLVGILFVSWYSVYWLFFQIDYQVNIYFFEQLFCELKKLLKYGKGKLLFEEIIIFFELLSVFQLRWFFIVVKEVSVCS